MSASAAVVIELHEMPQVGELWHSMLGYEVTITAVEHGIFKYHAVLPNGRHYDGAFEPKGILNGSATKLADTTPEDHPVNLPEVVREKFQGVPLKKAPAKE